MSEKPSEQENPVAGKIERFLQAVDRALAESGMAGEERGNITADLRVQIEEMLAERATQSGQPAGDQDVEAVLAELDPPESYAESPQSKEEEKFAFAGHGCGGGRHREGHRRGHWGGFKGRRRAFWAKRNVVQAFRHAMESFSPFGHPAFHGMTERARTAISLAKGEARRMHHDFIGTEHLLLGLILEGTGVAGQTLAGLGLEREWAREEAARLVPPGNAPPQERLPLTPRLTQAIEDGRLAARKLGHDFLGTEHLLLGLLRNQGVAAQIIANRGLTTEQVEAEILKRMQAAPPSPVSAPIAGNFIYWPASSIQDISVGENRYKIIAGGGDTGAAFTAIEAVIVKPDGLGPRTHSREDISIYVQEGGVRLRVGDRSVDLAQGDFSRIPRGTPHEIQPASASAKVMLIATPGGIEKMFGQLGSAGDAQASRAIATRFGVTVE